MLTENAKEKITQVAIMINEASEKYQLTHATFAIEKMFKDKKQKEDMAEFDRIRYQLMTEQDDDKRKELIQEAAILKAESNRKFKILIEYIPQIKENSARITRTNGNIFMIVLPKCMENIRKSDGTVDNDKMSKLRFLVAHELGHIVLHSGVMDFNNISSSATSEEEADFFAEVLLGLRECVK